MITRLFRTLAPAICAIPLTGDHCPVIPALGWYSGLSYLAFLRHPGCPFAEQTIKLLRQQAASMPEVRFVAILHGDGAAAESWLAEIGGAGSAVLIFDESGTLYAQWGLGFTGAGHFLGLSALLGLLALLRYGIRNRAASGTRWQRAGSFVINSSGVLLWKHLPVSAQDVPQPAAVLAPFIAARGANTAAPDRL